jgi:ribosomal protein S18 acetylase RimI-like enzyme
VQQGFQPGGQFSEVNLVCALSGPLGGPLGGSLGEGTGDALVEAPIPDGFEVRELAETEIAKRAEAHRAVWLPWTDGNVSDDDYAYFMKLPGYQRDLDVVAVAPDGTIAAFVNGWIDPRNRIGDFGPVGACPRYRRLGLTRAVLLECLRRMQRLGMERVIVSTGVSNTPAICLYESVGFRVVNQYIEYIKMN